MKISGQPLAIKEVINIKLPRQGKDPIEFKVCGLPIGFHQEYDLVWPRPRPPFKIINKAGGKTEKDENYEDPTFLKDVADYRYYKNIFTVYKGLLADDRVTFDCLNGKPLENKEQLVKITEEMKQAGLSEGDIGILLEGVTAASHIDQKEVDAAIKGF